MMVNRNHPYCSLLLVILLGSLFQVKLVEAFSLATTTRPLSSPGSLSRQSSSRLVVSFATTGAATVNGNHNCNDSNNGDTDDDHDDLPDLLRQNGEKGSNIIEEIPDKVRSSIQEFDQTVAKIPNPTNRKQGGNDNKNSSINPILQDDAKPLSFDKYMTMQEKRVVVTIRYSEASGFKPYFLTLAKKLKASHPDILMERRIFSVADHDDKETLGIFQVLVDGKLVLPQQQRERSSTKFSLATAARPMIFVSMQEMELAISRARRRRRPSTAYGGAAVTTTTARTKL